MTGVIMRNTLPDDQSAERVKAYLARRRAGVAPSGLAPLDRDAWEALERVVKSEEKERRERRRERRR